MTQTQEPPPPEIYLTRLTNPYPGARQGDPGIKRLSLDIPQADEDVLKQVRLERGNFTTLILSLRLFVRCLAQECREQGWTFDNQKEFEDFVLSRTQTTKEKQTNGINSTTIHDHGTTSTRFTEGLPPRQGPHRDVGVGTPRVRQAVSRPLRKSGDRTRKQAKAKVKEGHASRVSRDEGEVGVDERVA